MVHDEVVMKDLPYTVIAKRRLGYEAERWCKEFVGHRWEAIGNRDGVWTCFWAGRKYPYSYKWHFKYEKDAIWFSLKWI